MEASCLYPRHDHTTSRSKAYPGIWSRTRRGAGGRFLSTAATSAMGTARDGARFKEGVHRASTLIFRDKRQSGNGMCLLAIHASPHTEAVVGPAQHEPTRPHVSGMGCLQLHGELLFHLFLLVPRLCTGLAIHHKSMARRPLRHISMTVVHSSWQRSAIIASDRHETVVCAGRRALSLLDLARSLSVADEMRRQQQ